MLEFFSSLLGSGIVGKIGDLVALKYITGAGLPGALMLGAVAYMIFLVRNHRAPEAASKFRLFDHGYLVADLMKIAFAFLVFISGVIFFRWPK